MKLQIALAAVPISIARKYVKNWNKNGIGVKAVRKLMPKPARGYRLYLPIKARPVKVKVPQAIKSALTTAGYRIDDYITGIAVDSSGKRRMRIGKLLKDEKLRQEFANDPQRSAHKDEYACVISAHPYDVIGMSTGRRWDATSCMRLDQPGKSRGGAYQGTVSHDVAEGTIVAYAVSPKDTNINEPHARLLIKPFHKEVQGTRDSTAVFFRVETKVYGTPIPGFLDTVKKWVNKINKDAASGIYVLAPELYNDGVGDVHFNSRFDNVLESERMAYIQRHIDHISGIVEQDPKWFNFLIQNIHSFRSTPHECASFIWGVYSHSKTKKLAGIIEKEMPDTMLPEFSNQVLASYEDEKDTVKNIPRLGAYMRDKYKYDPDEKISAYDIIPYARANPEWLANVQDLDKATSLTLLKDLTSARIRLTPTFAKSKNPDAQTLYKYLAISVRILAASLGDSERCRYARRLLPRLKCSFAYDANVYALMSIPWSNAMRRFVDSPSDNIKGILLSIDVSWIAERPDDIYNVGQYMYEKDVFPKLLALQDSEIDYVLMSKIKIYTQGGYLPEWVRKYPWVRAFLDKYAGTDGSMGELADGYLAQLGKRQQEMDDIFADLESAGFSE